MPKRTDIKKILIIGSGPIVIGQACEFDYSGTQACKALREEGYEIVLVNSNPATIMTDPELSDRTYIEPLTLETLIAIIEKERPDALLPTVGGQTGLNLSVALYEQGILDKFGVKLIGANIDAIRVGEDRELFKKAMDDARPPRQARELFPSESRRIIERKLSNLFYKPNVPCGGDKELRFANQCQAAGEKEVARAYRAVVGCYWDREKLPTEAERKLATDGNHPDGAIVHHGPHPLFLDQVNRGRGDYTEISRAFGNGL